MSFDFGITRGKNIDAWPLFRRIKSRDKKEVDAFFSIYRSREIYNDSLKYSHFIPFYIQEKSPLLNDFRFASLYYPSLFHRTTDYKQQIRSTRFLEIAPKISMVELTRSQDGLFIQNNILFLLWHKNDQKRKHSHLVLFPFYWSFQNPDRSSYTLFPLYSGGSYHNRESKYLVVTPLFWHFKEKESVSNVLFPFWWQNKWESGENEKVQNIVMPLFWSYRDKFQNNKILFPFVWSFNNSRYKSFTFFPLISSGHSKKNEKKHLAVTPLFWHFSNENAYRNILFPIWWQKKIKQGNYEVYSNTIFPFYWSYQDNIKSYKVLFPLIWSRKNEHYRSFTFLPFMSYGKSEDGSRSRLMLTPFFWHTRKTDETRNVLFPLWWQHKKGSGENEKYSNVVFPVYWAFKDRDKNNKVLFPLIWSFDNNKYKSFTLAPLLSSGHSKDGNEKHLMITPLFWHVKNGEEFTNVLFPLWWQKARGYGAAREYSNVIFPLWFSYKDQNKNNKVLFPVLWDLKNSRYRSWTIAPLFSTGHSIDEKVKHTVITPLFWNIQHGEEYTKLLFPLWWNIKQGTGENAETTNVLFPFWWKYKDKEKHNRVFFPLIWSLSNKKYESFTVFPVLSSGCSQDSSMKHRMITPLFWHFKNKDSYSNTLFPLWWQRKSGDGDNLKYTNVIFPFWWSYKNKQKDYRVLFPVLWTIKDERYKSVTFAPFFSKGTSSDKSAGHLVITPLFWHFKDQCNYKNLLLPVWYQFQKCKGSDTLYSNTVFPFYWSRKYQGKENTVLFPLVWKFKDKEYTSYTVPPLFSYGKSPDKTQKHLTITPFFWHLRKGENYQNILFPVWWQKKNIHAGTENYHNVFFPFFWHTKGPAYENKILFPFVWDFKNKKYSSYTFFPVFSKGSTADGSTTHKVITPLFWNVKNGDRHSVVLFPVLWNFKDEKYSSQTIFPFFSVGKSTDNTASHAVITPLFWHIREKENYKNVFFPLWWKQRKCKANDTIDFHTIFPLYWSYKDNQYNNKILFPLVWKLKDYDYSSFTVPPLFSYGRSLTGNDHHLMISLLFWQRKKHDDFHRVLFPLWWQFSRWKGSPAEESRHVIFPLYWAKKDRDRDTKVLFPLVWGIKNEEYKSFTVFPFYSKGISTNGKQSHLVVSPLFWHVKDGETRRNILFPLWWQKKKGEGENQECRNVVFPFYWSKKNLRHDNKVLFPFVWSMNNYRYKSFTFAPLFSYGRSNDNLKSHLMITPLFWKTKSGDHQRTLLLPFFMAYSDTMQRSNMNFMFFLFRRLHDKTKTSTSILWPIVEYRKDIDYRYFRFAPIVWYEKTAASRYFSIQPLFYASSDSLSSGYNIFWLLMNRRNYFNVKTSTNFLWKAVKWDNYYNGDFEHRVLHLVYANVKKDGNIEKSLFPFYHKTEEKNGNKSLSVFFHFYNSFKRQIPDTEEFYQEDRILWFLRLRSNYKKLKGKGIDEKRIKGS